MTYIPVDISFTERNLHILISCGKKEIALSPAATNPKSYDKLLRILESPSLFNYPLY